MEEKEVKQKKSLALAYILYKLLINYEIEESEIVDEIGVKKRTIKKYINDLNIFFKSIIKRKDVETTDDNQYNISIRSQREGFGKKYILYFIEQDKEGNYKKMDALEQMDAIATLALAKSILKSIRNEHLTRETEHIFNMFKKSLTYKDSVRSFFLNLDRIFYYHPYAPKDYSKHTEILKNILIGIYNKKVLKCEYSPVYMLKKGEREVVYTTCIEPYSVVFHLNALYLIGKERGTENPREKTYAIDRFKKVEVSGETFNYPSEGEYNPANLCLTYIGVISGGEIKKICIRFCNDSKLHKILKERHWFKSQKFTQEDDGTLTMSFMSPVNIELIRWIQSFGDDVIGVEPPISELKKSL